MAIMKMENYGRDLRESPCKDPFMAQGLHPPTLWQRQPLASMDRSQKHAPGQTHSIDQRPSLECRPVGWRWSPQSAGPARDDLQWVMGTTSIVRLPFDLGLALFALPCPRPYSGKEWLLRWRPPMPPLQAIIPEAARPPLPAAQGLASTTILAMAIPRTLKLAEPGFRLGNLSRI